jgi:hypothetical protein
MLNRPEGVPDSNWLAWVESRIEALRVGRIAALNVPVGTPILTTDGLLIRDVGGGRLLVRLRSWEEYVAGLLRTGT